jgi:hypothetical protein
MATKSESANKEESERVDGGRRLVDYAIVRPVASRAGLRSVSTMRFDCEARTPPWRVDVTRLRQRIEARARPLPIDEGAVPVVVDAVFSVLGADNSVVARVSQTLVLVYEIPGASELDPSAVGLFSEVNGLYNGWPYLREGVASGMSRLGMTGVTLPVLTAPASLPPSGEPVVIEYNPQGE